MAGVGSPEMVVEIDKSTMSKLQDFGETRLPCNDEDYEAVRIIYRDEDFERQGRIVEEDPSG